MCLVQWRYHCINVAVSVNDTTTKVRIKIPGSAICSYTAGAITICQSGGALFGCTITKSNREIRCAKQQNIPNKQYMLADLATIQMMTQAPIHIWTLLWRDNSAGSTNLCARTQVWEVPATTIPSYSHQGWGTVWQGLVQTVDGRFLFQEWYGGYGYQRRRRCVQCY